MFISLGEVLNAFRHQRSTQESYQTVICLRVLCSTPFGIKDQLSAMPKIRRSLSVLCSTPFGIKDQLSGFGQALSAKAFSAQRLSASKINSERPRKPFVPPVRCSTPFGIKDQLSPEGQGMNEVTLCAQRLSASKINSENPLRVIRVIP